mgnify:CR=1 FL=1
MEYILASSHLPQGEISSVVDFKKQGSIYTCELEFAGKKDLQKFKTILCNNFFPGQAIGLRPKEFFPKAVFMDMDGTIICEESCVHLAGRIGRAESFASLTDQAMQGEIDFSTSFNQRSKMLGSVTKEDVINTAKQLSLQKGVKELLAACRNNNISLFLATGGFDTFAQYFVDLLGFHDYCASKASYTSSGHLYFGKGDLIVTGEYKSKWMHDVCLQRGWQASEVVAIGDGANDQHMLEAAGVGVGFCPKEALIPHIDVYNDLADHSFLLDFFGV